MAAYYEPPPNLPRASRCTNHPDREGVGVCVSCRSVVCVECSTRIDRMNYCIQCLQAAAPGGAAKPESRGQEAAVGIPVLLASIAGTVLVFEAIGYVMAWIRR